MRAPGRLERRLDRLGLALATWRGAAAVTLVVGSLALVASLVVHPVAGTEQLYLGAVPFGDGCAWRRDNGFGCMNCGMTRSWVFAARGRVLQAFAYNAAGASLFYVLVFSGALGGVRLLLKRRILRIPGALLFGGLLAWLAVWGALFALRSQGFLPLPPDPPSHALEHGPH